MSSSRFARPFGALALIAFAVLSPLAAAEPTPAPVAPSVTAPPAEKKEEKKEREDKKEDEQKLRDALQGLQQRFQRLQESPGASGGGAGSGGGIADDRRLRDRRFNRDDSPPFPQPSFPAPQEFQQPPPQQPLIPRPFADERRELRRPEIHRPTPTPPPQRPDRFLGENDPLLGGGRVGDLPLPPIDPPAKDRSPIDDEDKLLVDFGFGLKGKKADEIEKAINTRLEGLVFAINSVNTSTKTLLTVAELKKQIAPGGKLRAGEIPSGKIDLSKYLTSTQILTFREILSEEALNCAAERTLQERRDRFGDDRRRRRPLRAKDDDDQPKAEPLRADVIVKAMMDQANYYKLMGLSDSRRNFEIDQAIRSEFDVDGPNKDQSEDTMRLILPPGKSGVAHPNAQRLILLQKSIDGRLVVRTGDVDKNDATKGKHNFIQRPGTARPSGSEEIWELPNGLRGYSARSGNGNLVTQVPHGLVVPKITNPGSCFSCHGDTGYIAGSGEFGSQSHSKEKPLKKVNVVDEVVDGKTFGNRNLFRATWDDYMGATAPANKRYEAALEKSGAGPRAMRSLLDQYAKDVSVAQLAAEVGQDEEEVEKILLSKRIRSSWDPSNDFDPKDKDAVKDLKLTRASLEAEVDLGAGKGDERTKKPLYCAVKDLTREQQARLSNQRSPTDAFVRGPKPSGKPTHDAR